MPGHPVAGKSADEGQGHHQEDAALAKPGRGLEVGDDERGQAAVRDRPGGVHLEEPAERRMVGHRTPGDRPSSAILFLGDGNIRDPAEEQERDEAGGAAEEEHDGELPGVGRITEHEGSEDEGSDAGTVVAELVNRQVTPADLGGNEVGDPGEPGAGREATGEVEGEEQRDDEGKP